MDRPSTSVRAREAPAGAAARRAADDGDRLVVTVSLAPRTPFRAAHGPVLHARSPASLALSRVVACGAARLGGAATIHAVRRSSEDTGTGKSRKARLAGLVPGLVYGKGGDGKNEYIPIWVRERDLAREYNARADSFENTLFDVVLGDQRIRVLPRQLEVHPGACVLSQREMRRERKREGGREGWAEE